MLEYSGHLEEPEVEQEDLQRGDCAGMRAVEALAAEWEGPLVLTF